MKNGYKLGLAAVAASISLVGCGSDSTSAETVTGQFVDTYVSGLNYACSSGATAITNNMGEYTCNKGDTVEFSLGGYVLGSVTASSGLVTPYTLYPSDTDVISPEAMNVAQLLQTFDDGSNEGIITIPENFTVLDDVNITLDDENFDDLMNTELQEVTLVTEEDAQAHLDESEFLFAVAGKTVYIPFSDEGGDNIGIWEFSADGTEITVTEESTFTESISFDANIIKVDNNDGTFTTIEATDIGTSSINVTFTDGNEVEYLTLYFDKADAEAALPGTTDTTPTDTTTEPTVPNTTPTALESFVSGKSIEFTMSGETGIALEALFMENGDYIEVTDETCNGKWSVVNEGGTDYIGVNCEPASSPVTPAIPTSPANSDLVYEFLSETDVILYTSENQNGVEVDVEFSGTYTLSDPSI